MLKEPFTANDDIALVSNSGIQLIDLDFSFLNAAGPSRDFVENPSLEDQSTQLSLIEEDPDTGVFLDSASKEKITSKSTYSVSFRDAARVFDGIWIPTPYFKLKSGNQQGPERYEDGPSVWSRMQLIRLNPSDDKTPKYRVVLAFDTRPEILRKNWPYIAPTWDDVENERRFEFATEASQFSWLIKRDKEMSWLKSIFEDAIGQKRISDVPEREDETPAECAYWAYYITLMEAMSEALKFPSVYFIDTVSQNASAAETDVDLVLDIGNSRTCGVLIETSAGNTLNLQNSTPLEIRDISNPSQVYGDPFQSHCEFNEASFGRNMESRRDAFSWPSPVRVGPEASRLNARSAGIEGDTGLSAPKRYLWDESPSQQQWYFNASNKIRSDQLPVSGPFMEHVTDAGDARARLGPETRHAMGAHFSRASLFTFSLLEIFLQAMVQINSPALRYKRSNPRTPRRLRRVILTIPSATPLVEQTAFKKRCQDAIDILWEVMNWNAEDLPSRAPSKPSLEVRYDEASATQIVYLYTEVFQKYRSTPAEYFAMRQKASASTDKPGLRVASIDIGGGTTDLMIATYGAEGAETISVEQNFREGFRKAGDDILEEVVSGQIIAQICDRLQEHGLAQPINFVANLLSDTGYAAPDRHKRTLFVTQILVPAAQALLTLFENSSKSNQLQENISLSDVVEEFAWSENGPAQFFNEALKKAGVEDFDLSQMSIEYDGGEMNNTVKLAIEHVVSKLSDVITAFDCDVLLLTGRPSRLNTIRDIVLSKLPVSPDRVVFMHEYKIGDWYPFADHANRIGDPKSTVVVGALLCALAEDNRLERFAIKPNSFKLLSTANFIGPMIDKNIQNSELIFQRDSDGTFDEESKPLRYEAPVRLGFRQMDDETWPATQLYFVQLVDDERRDKDSRTLPWTVIFGRPDDTADANGTTRPKKPHDERFTVARINDPEGTTVNTKRLDVRLQTLLDTEGYWLDTGKVSLDSLR